MLCPTCGKETRVVETDKLSHAVTRVRWCRNSACRQLFETQEVLSGLVVRQAQPAATPRRDQPAQDVAPAAPSPSGGRPRKRRQAAATDSA